MIIKLLTEYHSEFLSLKGGCRGSSGSTLAKLLEIYAAAHLFYRAEKVIYINQYKKRRYLTHLWYQVYKERATRKDHLLIHTDHNQETVYLDEIRERLI